MSTDDTIQRVARILGWEPRWPHRSPKGSPDGGTLSMKCAECGEWVDPIDRTSYCTVPWNPHWERDGRTRAGTPYDADDLMAWLLERGFDVFSGSDRTHLDVARLLGGRLTKVTLKPFKRHVMCFTAPTLLAALEAAVLAVAEAWPQRWMTGGAA